MNSNTTTFQRILQWMGSRLALNLYFWVFLFVLKESDIDDQTAYSKIFYYGMMVFYMLFFAALSYINNLILLPRLLFKQKRALYFLGAFGLVFCTSFIYTFMMKWMPMLIPGFDAMEVSVVMSPISNDLSPMATLADMQTYFSTMVVWVTIFTLLGYYHHSVQKMRSMQEAINQHRETELNLLRNQMNPHFLFNTLNNLYALTLKKSDEAPEAILKLSSVLRYVLYEADVRLVSFEKEQEVIQAYVDIELLRMQDSPQIQFAITADAPYQIPPLIWLPVLDNVFKHSRWVEEQDIDFSFTIRKGQLLVLCKNKFAQAPAGTKEEGGIGLSNLRKRLELLYPQKHTMVTTSSENYFIIEIKIDLL